MPSPVPMHCIPLTDTRVLEFYDWPFAPWVKGLGMREFSVAQGEVSALLPQSDALKCSSGAVCGQVIMAATDTIASLAMAATDRIPRGTVYQHTHFLRPAVNDDFRVKATGKGAVMSASEALQRIAYRCWFARERI